MILTTQKDFENAVLHGEEIKHKTVFYTGEIEENELERPLYDIGTYDARYGVYAGMCNHKQIWVALKDAPEEKNWQDAVDYCDGNTHLPTKEELMLIYVNKDIINKALTAAGGEPMKEDYYWSSSEGSIDLAWGQYFGNGYISYNLKNSNGNFVRPVLALSI